MDLFERILFFLIGAGTGFILGYVVARLRVIEVKVDAVKSEVHEVDQIVKQHEKDERGAIHRPSGQSLLMTVVLMLVVLATFMTAKVNEELDDTVACLTDFNTNQGKALVTRDIAIEDLTDAEIALWTKYEQLYAQAQEVREDPEELAKLQDELNAAIMKYRLKLSETQEIRNDFAYDDPDVYQDCEENPNG